MSVAGTLYPGSYTFQILVRLPGVAGLRKASAEFTVPAQDSWTATIDLK